MKRTMKRCIVGLIRL